MHDGTIGIAILVSLFAAGGGYSADKPSRNASAPFPRVWISGWRADTTQMRDMVDHGIQAVGGRDLETARKFGLQIAMGRVGNRRFASFLPRDPLDDGVFAARLMDLRISGK